MNDESPIYAKRGASKRTMTPLRRFAYRLLVPIAYALVRLAWSWVRKPRTIGEAHADAALARHPSFIPVLWHQHQLFCARWLVGQRERGVKPGFLISPSVDGEIGAMLVDRAGGVAIRGSSSHTGAKALRDFYEALVKQGVSPIITPDGPRGPPWVFKPGAILLAQMSGRPMLPMAYAASRAILFHWDRFVIPLPFSKVVVAIGEPRYVPRTMDAKSLEALQVEMAGTLRSLFGQAKEALDE